MNYTGDKMPTLTPAYGRDFKSAKAIEAAYFEGVDFILNDVTSPYNGKYCSCRDFLDKEVKLRYDRLKSATLSTYRSE